MHHHLCYSLLHIIGTSPMRKSVIHTLPLMTCPTCLIRLSIILSLGSILFLHLVKSTDNHLCLGTHQFRHSVVFMMPCSILCYVATFGGISCRARCIPIISGAASCAFGTSTYSIGKSLCLSALPAPCSQLTLVLIPHLYLC